jgi:hypothetical protein
MNESFEGTLDNAIKVLEEKMATIKANNKV